MKKTIIIADDHPIFRKGLVEVIKSISTFEIVGEATTGSEALNLIKTKHPDIALVDINMPVLTGLDVARQILASKNKTNFIILTLHKEKHYFEEAKAIGVCGYLLKENAIDEIETCLLNVAQNKKYISQEIQSYFTETEKISILKLNLTATEKVILKLVAEGKSSIQIAEMLFLSPKTIDNHRSNIGKKVGVEGKNGLMKYALNNKDLL